MTGGFNPDTNSPSDFPRRSSTGRESLSSLQDFENNENIKDPNLKPARVQSPASASKGMNNFMSPTISSASKFATSPRKKILAERNEPVQSSVSFSEAKVQAVEDNDSKPEISLGKKKTATFSDVGDLIMEENDFSKPEMSLNQIVSSHDSTITDLGREETVKSDSIFNSEVLFDSKNDVSSSLEAATGEKDSVNINPTLKISPRTSCPPLGPMLAPLDVDPLKPARVQSPASASKGMNNFMSPTISSASKFATSPRKKILAERNEPVQSSVSFSEAKVQAVEDNDSKPEISLGKKKTATFSDVGDLIMEENDFSKPEMSSNQIVSSHDSTITDLGREETVKSDSIFNSEVLFDSKNDVSSSLEAATGEKDSVNINPTLKISPRTSCPPLGPMLAPLDVDPLMPPYDPKTNYLVPRPQFLYYRPNMRIKYMPHKDKDSESFASENSSDSEGIEILSQEESEDISSVETEKEIKEEAVDEEEEELDVSEPNEEAEEEEEEEEELDVFEPNVEAVEEEEEELDVSEPNEEAVEEEEEELDVSEDISSVETEKEIKEKAVEEEEEELDVSEPNEEAEEEEKEPDVSEPNVEAVEEEEEELDVSEPKVEAVEEEEEEIHVSEPNEEAEEEEEEELDVSEPNPFTMQRPKEESVAKGKSKSKCFTVPKFIAFFLVLFFACLSLSVSDSQVTDFSLSTNFYVLHEVTEFAKVNFEELVRKSRLRSAYSFAYIFKLISSLRGMNTLGPLQYSNLSVLLEKDHLVDDGHLKFVQKDASADFNYEKDFLASIRERNVDSEPLEEEGHEEIEDDKNIEEEENQSDVVIPEVTTTTQPDVKISEVIENQPDVAVLKVFKIQPDVSFAEEEPHGETDVNSELDASRANLQNLATFNGSQNIIDLTKNFVSISLSVLLSLLVAIAFFTYANAKKGKPSTPISVSAEHTLQEKMLSSRNWQTEVQVGECPSEMSSFKSISSRNWQIQDEMVRESCPSESHARAYFPMGSLPYGGFSSYEKISPWFRCLMVLKGHGEDEVVTPVRRSSRIRKLVNFLKIKKKKKN